MSGGGIRNGRRGPEPHPCVMFREYLGRVRCYGLNVIPHEDIPNYKTERAISHFKGLNHLEYWMGQPLTYFKRRMQVEARTEE